MIHTNLYFDEPTHKYYDVNGNVYISCTQLIERFDFEFDKEFWANAKAVEYIFTNRYNYEIWNNQKKELGYEKLISICLKGIKPEVLNQAKEKILTNWKDTTIIACDKGNLIHNQLEDSIHLITKYSNTSDNKQIRTVTDVLNDNTNQLLTIDDLKNTVIYHNYKPIFEYLCNKINDGFSLYAEVGVYDTTTLISGRIDLVLINNNTKEFEILDWKTNKDELHFESGYYKKKNGIKTNTWIKTNDCLRFPINHLSKSKGSKYTLQLSLYAYLMELYGFKCVGLTLCHIRSEIKFYEIKYLKGEIKLIIKYK